MIRAFDAGSFSFDKIQDVNTTLSVVEDWSRKPVTSSLDEFARVQASAFFRRLIVAAEDINFINE